MNNFFLNNKLENILQKNKFNILFLLLIICFILIINKNKNKKNKNKNVKLVKKYNKYPLNLDFINVQNNKVLLNEKNEKSKHRNILHKSLTYKICDEKKLIKPLKRILEKHNIKNIEYEIKRKNKKDWDLYLPCGYNYAEIELQQIKLSSPNQMIYAIKGCDKIASKNELWKIVNNYYGRKIASTLIPETFIINDLGDIKLFKKQFNKNEIYFLKKNIQRKEGILITSDYDQIMKNVMNSRKDLKDYYKNNFELYNKSKNLKEEENFSKLSKINTLPTNFKIIQKGIKNLFLVKNRKVNLRLYLLITIKQGIKRFFLYNEGKCIYTQKDVNILLDKDKIDKEQHLTSYNLDSEIYKTHPESISDLSKFLNIKKLLNNINSLFKNIVYAIKDEIGNSKRLKNNLTFQLFGADVIFTKTLHPYLLEFNKGPSMKFITERDHNMKMKLLEDVFLKVGLIKNQQNTPNNNFIEI